MKETWIDEIYDACLDAGTTFFFKQWGDVNKKKNGHLYKNRLWNDYPITYERTLL